MIEKVADIIWCSTASLNKIAADVLDAILPQVTTVEELEALPGGSLLALDGGVVYRWRSLLNVLQAVTESPYDYRAEEILGRGPLTVVWSPS
jgi:hypothetical protein